MRRGLQTPVLTLALAGLLTGLSAAAYADLPECSDRKVEREIKNGFSAAQDVTKSGRRVAKVEGATETHQGIDPVNGVPARYCDVRVQLDNGETLTSYVKVLDLDSKRQNYNEIKTCWDGKYWANTSFTCANYTKAPGRK